MIFDEDRDNRYPYTTTWLGENQNESDMAFYSTLPFENLAGPGIGRAEYGGFLMSLPPRRMYDVWRDADYEFAESKSERLLLAALDYSIHRLRGIRGRQTAPLHLQNHRFAHGPDRGLHTRSASFHRCLLRRSAWFTCWMAMTSAKPPKTTCGEGGA